MITTVCLNPAVDQSATVDGLQVGGVNRLRDTRAVIGGKGINVAIVLKRLRTDVNCVSFVGEADAAFFARSMQREGVLFDAVRVPGSVRRNLKIADTAGRSVTEFNERGAEADAATLESLIAMLYTHVEDSRYYALCGSLPPGCGLDTCQTVVRSMPGKRWIVDTSGEALRSALQAKPYLIKPNLAELEELVKKRLPTPEAVRDAAVKLCGAGITYVAVSLGAQGALLTDGARTVFAPAIPVIAASTVGAGDAMLAGMLSAMDRGETVFNALRYGTAAAAACVRDGGIHAFGEQAFNALLSRAEIREF